jgi:DNA polymerase III subunit beta
MKFTCLQENLAHGLGVVAKAIPTKSSLPILSNIFMSAENGQIKIAATNLETTIVTNVGASIEKEGSITVPAKLIKDFISTLSPSTINIEMKDDILHLMSDRTKSRFNGVPADDYPPLPQFPAGDDHIKLDPKVFASAVATVAFSAAMDQVRPIFTGIFMKFEDGLLTIASSDGFRLSEKKFRVEADSPDFFTVIPAKTLLEVARIFAQAEEPLKFHLSSQDNMALFEADDTLVASQVIGGEYPNYQRIIPTEDIISAEFSAEELLEAVRLTNVFSKEANAAVKIKFGGDGYISVVSVTQETGGHESKMTAEIEGEEMEIAFNSKYLLDFLTNIKAQKVLFKAKNSTSPCLFQPKEHEDYIHVIAPMQIQG